MLPLLSKIDALAETGRLRQLRQQPLIAAASS